MQKFGLPYAFKPVSDSLNQMIKIRSMTHILPPETKPKIFWV